MTNSHLNFLGSVFLLSLIVSVSAAAMEDSYDDVYDDEQDTELEYVAEREPSSTFDLAKEVAKFKNRYQVNDPSTKVTRNNGVGRSRLYGTRNFRVVLHGVMYRGGANNKYFVHPRSNMNPLPRLGLENLCKEDFSTAVYLYPDHFDRAPKQVSCSINKAHTNHVLKYKQYSPARQNYLILKMVYERIKGKLDGPIYTHCWNGWHASGLISGIALKQFCGWNNTEAVAYWYKNTDGNTQGYSSLRRTLRQFKPYKEFAITKKERALICPTKNMSLTELADADVEEDL